MLPDVLQSGMFAPIELLLRSVASTIVMPIALGIVAYLWMCCAPDRR